ncbi:50S ribosomal protein L18, partial [bacterium]|nr:50S ribosomal protein L18 [bacterium]
SSTKDKNLHKGELSLNKIERAKIVGGALAENAKSVGIKRIVFDRSGYKFHGRVKALAESARDNGLLF